MPPVRGHSRAESCRGDPLVLAARARALPAWLRSRPRAESSTAGPPAARNEGCRLLRESTAFRRVAPSRVMSSAKGNTFNALRWPEGWGTHQVASSAVGRRPTASDLSPVVARLLGRLDSRRQYPCAERLHAMLLRRRRRLTPEQTRATIGAAPRAENSRGGSKRPRMLVLSCLNHISPAGEMGARRPFFAKRDRNG